MAPSGGRHVARVPLGVEQRPEQDREHDFHLVRAFDDDGCVVHETADALQGLFDGLEATQCVEAGNADAIAILHRAADHLAAHIEAAWRLTKAETPIRWSYAGGVFNSPIVSERIAVQVGCDPVAPRLPPIGGALLRAAANAEWPVDEAWIDRLSSSLSTQLQA